jgi:hypothetical protein
VSAISYIVCAGGIESIFKEDFRSNIQQLIFSLPVKPQNSMTVRHCLWFLLLVLRLPHRSPLQRLSVKPLKHFRTKAT